MANFDEIGLSEPSTITKKLAAISIDRNSTTQFQEVMSIGSPNSTTKLAVAEVLGTAPQSTVVGLAVRVVSGPSTATDLAVRALLPSTVGDNRVTVYQSTQGDLRASVYQPTAADLNVTVAGYVAPSTTITIRQSTATDLLARVSQGPGISTLADRWLVNVANSSAADFVGARLVDSSGTGFHGPTKPLPIAVTDSSNAVVKPGDSDNNAIRVNVVAGAAGGSTIMTVSTGSVRVHQSSAADLNVTVSGYVAPSTTITIRQSTATDLLARVNQGVGNSSAADRWRVNAANSSAQDYIPVRFTDGSTFLAPTVDYTHGSTLTASTVAGPAVMLRASSTIPPAVSTSDLWVTQWGTLNGAGMVSVVTSSGASVMDSTETAIKVNVVAGAAGGSTTVTIRQSTATDLLARVNQGVGNSTAADRWRVMVANSSAADFIGVQLVDSSGTGFYGPTKPLNVTVTDSSNAVVKPGDSDNNAIRVNVVAGAAAGSTLVTVRQSTYTDFNTLSRIADRDQSTQVAAVLNATPASTVWALAVREAAPSTGPIAVSSIAGPVTVRSSAANALVTVYQSTAADLKVTVDGYSTTVNVSSGVVRAQTYTSSGGAVEGSTGTPAAGVLGVHVRQVYPTMNSTTIVVTSTHSTAIYPLISSVAGLRHKVYAYFVSSTHTVPSTLIFCSSASASGFDHWHVGFGSGSSGMTGANLAVAPPGFIFAGVSQNALNVKIEGGSSAASTVIARVSVAWFDEA
jgi:hypothetical protein